MDAIEPLSWSTDRRYGVEMELNAFDGLSRPKNPADLPAGIEEVGEVVATTLETAVNVRPWEHTHNNENWVVKPDGSCGMEVCSPILKGWRGLESVVRCARAFADDPRIDSDSRCSLHVHVNVYDCSIKQVASIVAQWIKCEAVFVDSVPANRKRSRYCQIVGMCDMFDTRDMLDAARIIEKMGKCKYFTLNNLHYSREKRKTIEFRIAENRACTDPVFVKNWTRLVVHFCDMVKDMPLPSRYEAGDPSTSLCWLDPIAVFRLLGFMPGQYDLSPGLSQTRDWFLSRLLVNTRGAGLDGVFSDHGRSRSWEQTQSIASDLGFVGPEDVRRHLNAEGQDMGEWLYDKRLQV